ncbi:hypothetical protein CL654_02630 [bacterium]|nr:hypothetical protein [bacterium]
MSHRSDSADALEKKRDTLLSEIEKYPLEITSPEGIPKEERFRAVIWSEEDLDKLIQQLRADSVSAQEALNESLVR